LEDEENSETIDLPPSLQEDEFIIEKKFLSIGNQYHIKNDRRNEVGFCEEESLKLKGELKVYDGSEKEKELFRIKQENFINMSGSFKVVNEEREKVIGFLKRKLPKSALLSDWDIMDQDRKVIGSATEDSIVKELIRFKALRKLPYRYKLYQDDKKIGVCKQRLTMLKNVYRLKVERELEPKIDKRLLLSLGILLDAVEGKYRKMRRVFRF